LRRSGVQRFDFLAIRQLSSPNAKLLVFAGIVPLPSQ